MGVPLVVEPALSRGEGLEIEWRGGGGLEGC